MSFRAADSLGTELAARIYYSVGGGFVVDEGAAGTDRIKPDDRELPYLFSSAVELLELTARTGLPISGLILANETAWRPEEETIAGLLERWQVMTECVRRGCATAGTLPGGLKAGRPPPAAPTPPARGRAAGHPPRAVDLLTLYALAASQEHAPGRRGVTTPTD